MILIGQYDSPFVRRVAIALRLYGLPYEHRPWSTFGDADKLAAFNPLRRVPTLLLDGGEVLIESGAILDYLDELVGPEKAMIADSGAARRRALKICALGSGLADKAVSLIYERVLRKEQLQLWVERCQAQIGGVLDVLEKERAGVATPFCSCSAVPAFIGFVAAGIPLGVTLSFLIASPLVNELTRGNFVFVIRRAFWKGIWIVVGNCSIREYGDYRAIGVIDRDNKISVAGEFDHLSAVLCVESIPAM